MTFGISPNVLAMSPAQILAAQDRQKQMAMNYELSMRGLALRQQQIARAGGGGGFMPFVSREQTEMARAQQQMQQQIIDQQLRKEQDEAYRRSILYAKGLISEKDYWEGKEPEKELTPVEEIRIKNIQSQIREREKARGKEFIGEPPPGYEIGYDKLGNRILVRKKEIKPPTISKTRIEELEKVEIAPPELPRGVRGPMTRAGMLDEVKGLIDADYTPEEIEAEPIWERVLPENRSSVRDYIKKLYEHRQKLLKARGIVTEELPELKQRVAPSPARGITLRPETGRYEYSAMIPPPFSGTTVGETAAKGNIIFRWDGTKWLQQ